jgi:hypothetical protein
MKHPTIAIQRIEERDIDLLLLEELGCNPDFLAWMLTRLKIEPSSLIQVEHSVFTVNSESDLIISYQSGNQIHAVLIEDKIAANFTKDQDQNYRFRGEHGIEQGNWQKFTTALIAPSLYINSASSTLFEHKITFEEVDEVFANMEQTPRIAYRRMMLAKAIEKKSKPSSAKIISESNTAFFRSYRRLANDLFPELPFKEEVARTPKNYWVMFNFSFLPSNFLIELKAQTGVVDLRLHGVTQVDLLKNGRSLVGSSMTTTQAKASSSVRMIERFSMDVRCVRTSL